jgi:UDP-3-O-[3-hydroxymyristoyl] glucosamine N-acyltransferase
VDGGTLTPALDQKQAAMRFLEIASRLGGQVVGPAADFEVRGVTTLEEAGPGWMSFITSARFLDDAKQSRASGFLATAKTVVPDRPCIVLDNVWKGMLFLLNRFHVAPQPPSAIHPTAVIGADVSLGREVSVGPYVVIEDGVVLGDRVRIGAHGLVGRGTRIGADSILHPRVTVLHDCEIGERVILHPGAVIGADGFKYEFIESRLTKIPQIGRVVLEDDVEVGANTTIDRASFTETRVCRGVKIDNLCMIAHNVRIGAGTVIVSQAGIAGSTRVGENCLIAGQAGIADNLEIGDRAKIGAKAGVKNDVPPDVYYLGSPAMPAKHFMRICADLNHLNEMRDRLRRIELRLEKQDEGTQGT